MTQSTNPRMALEEEDQLFGVTQSRVQNEILEKTCSDLK